MNSIHVRLLLLTLLLAGSTRIVADAEIGRVYHPYVEPMEKEIELRSNIIDAPDSEEHSDQKHWPGAGYSISERWFVEANVIAAKDNGESLELEGFELEARRQLTEQGEYWADRGMLFEVERETSENTWERKSDRRV